MKLIQMIILTIVCLLTIFQMSSLSSSVYPIKSQSIQHSTNNVLRKSAVRVGIGDPGEKILNAISMTSKQTGISESFLLSLMHTESALNRNARSHKNYKGLMQIPQDVYYEDANTLIGARIFLEKLRITDGDYRKALVLYKGWSLTSSEGFRQADKVINLTRKLKEKI